MSVPKRRRGRPPKHSWFNPTAAHGRLQELDRIVEGLQAERALLQQILGRAVQAIATGARTTVSKLQRATVVVGGRRGRRRGRGGGPSLLDIIEKVMQGQPSRRWTVGELRDEMLKVAPDRASAANASALISSALVQALRAKKPRFSGSKGGRGHARKYRMAVK
jgi:predicted NBD/HSP70 family sugar kinase